MVSGCIPFIVKCFLHIFSLCTKYVISDHLGTMHMLGGGHQHPRLLPACGALMKGPRVRVTVRFRTDLTKWVPTIAPRQPGHGMSSGLWEECSTFVQYCLSRDNIKSITCSCSSKFIKITCPANLSSRDQKCLRGRRNPS